MIKVSDNHYLNDLPQSFQVMIIREQKTYKNHIINMLDKLSNINQWRKDFIIENLTLKAFS